MLFWNKTSRIGFVVWVYISLFTESTLTNSQGISSQKPWKQLSTDKYELSFYDAAEKNWNSARTKCKNFGADLVQLDDIDVRNIVKETIKSAKIVDYFWIGARGKCYKWKWLDGKQVNMNISWRTDQPDYYNKRENRLLIAATESTFSDIHGEYEYAGVICQKKRVLTDETYTLKFYRFYKPGKSYKTDYDSAASACTNENSIIVYLNNEKNTLIKEFQKNSRNQRFWIRKNKNDATCSVVSNNVTTENCNAKHYFICEQVVVRNIKVSNSEIQINRTSTKKINCTATGVPRPLVLWKKNNITITNLTSITVYQAMSPGVSTLILDNATVIDEGIYSCVATNIITGKINKQKTTAHITVPSNPIILSATPQSCNSSLVIVWKPHERAVGVNHRISLQNTAGSKKNDSIYLIHTTNLMQTFFSGNLTASTLYNISINLCIAENKCTKYSSHITSYTGGIPGAVPNATLYKQNGVCNVSWSEPKNTPNEIIKGYKVSITSSLAKISKNSNSTIYKEEVTTISSALFYVISRLPNRNHSVFVEAVTCAGSGTGIIATGKCITEPEAPTVIAQPHAYSNISKNGTLKIALDVPDETNGPISCIFVIVAVGKVNNKVFINHEYLKQLNNGNISNEYISIAAERESLQDFDSKLSFILGDGSKTTCNIFGKTSINRRKRTTSIIAEKYGQNKKLSQNVSNQINIVTVTPSGSKVFFQTSEGIVVGEVILPSFPPKSNEWITPLLIVLCLVIVIVIIIVIVFFLRRRQKSKRIMKSSNRTDVVIDDFSVSFNRADTRENNIDQQIESHTNYANEESSKPGNDVAAQGEVLYENFQSEKNVKMTEFEAYYNKLGTKNKAIFMQQFTAIVEKSTANNPNTIVASKIEYKKLNRYKNILPYDNTRVVIKGSETGYINACYVNGFDKERQFIATQGPLSSTVDDFWLMAVEQGCRVILMLAKCLEAGKKKCYKYWPDKDTSMTFGLITVCNLKEENFCGFVRRTFRVYIQDEKTVDILQYQYTNWPDHGVPYLTSSLVRMQTAVTNSLQDIGKNSPMIVHCSAGAGRTGTYIGYDILLEETRNMDRIDVFNCVLEMRAQRVDMVQNCDQYILLHKLILESYLFGKTDFPSNEFTEHFSDLVRKREILSTEFENISLVRPLKCKADKGSQNENQERNLSSHIIPYDHNLVYIPPEGDDVEAPYINASWIECYDENCAMIAAQAPLESTVECFWRAVLSNNVNTIVMLASDQDCSTYWPPATGQVMTLNNKLAVTLQSASEDGPIIERTIKLLHGCQEILVKHLQLTSWDANQCPENSQCILQLIEKMQSNIRQIDNAAALIHCSDGAGRTGTFCAIVNLIERLKIEGSIDVFRTVKDLRDSRQGMVQTLNQYVFCYQAVLDYLKSFEIYANFE